MTSQPSDPPASGPAGSAGSPDPAAGGRSADQFTGPLRQPAALVLLIANGLILMFAVVDMFVIVDNWPANFLARTDSSFGDFVGLVSIGFPLLAVLLATHLKPPVPQARLITVLALLQYGVSALFGAMCLLVSLLHGLSGIGSTLGLSPARRAFEDFLLRGGSFAVLAVAALAVYRVFHGMYPPAPPAAPYGGGYLPGYPQPGHPSPYGHPAYPPGTHPPAGYTAPPAGYTAPPAGYTAPPAGWAPAEPDDPAQRGSRP